MHFQDPTMSFYFTNYTKNGQKCRASSINNKKPSATKRVFQTVISPIQYQAFPAGVYVLRRDFAVLLKANECYSRLHQQDYNSRMN